MARINVEDKLAGASTPLFQYKEFLVGWSGESAVRRVVFILAPFQVSINSLESAVTKTVAQTAVATIRTDAVMPSVDWRRVASASVLAGILSLLMSVAGLPEVPEMPG